MNIRIFGWIAPLVLLVVLMFGSSWSSNASANPIGLDLLVNGNFESGPGIGWQEFVDGNQVADGTLVLHRNETGGDPPNGNYIGRPGYRASSTSSIRQTFTLPPNLKSAKIKYLYCQNSRGDRGGDVAKAKVNGETKQTLNLTTRTRFRLFEINVLEYAGQEVTLEFEVSNDDDSAVGWYYVEDISLELEYNPEPTSTSTNTSTPTDTSVPPTATETPTLTDVPTSTDTPTATNTPTPTDTPVPTPTATATETEVPNRPPNVPSNPLPGNEATDVISNFLSWHGGDLDDDTVSYEVFLGRSEDDLEEVKESISFDEADGYYRIRVDRFLPGATFYWKVTAKDEHGLTAESPIWSYTVTESGCQSEKTYLNICDLEIGDILLTWRGEKTAEQLFIRNLLGTYFWHSAIYVGDGQIVHATGVQNTVENEIRQQSVFGTSWWKSEISDWIVLRPEVPEEIKAKAVAEARNLDVQNDLGAVSYPTLSDFEDKIASKEDASLMYCSKLTWWVYFGFGFDLEENPWVLHSSNFYQYWDQPDDFFVTADDLWYGRFTGKVSVVQDKRDFVNFDRRSFRLVYPYGQVSSATLTDAPITFSLVGNNGERLGVDPNTGEVVNDFEDIGFYSEGNGYSPATIWVRTGDEDLDGWSIEVSSTITGTEYSLLSEIQGQDIVTQTVYVQSPSVDTLTSYTLLSKEERKTTGNILNPQGSVQPKGGENLLFLPMLTTE